MEAFRIGEKNKINNRINEINIFFRRNKETIKRFKGQTKVSEFELKQIEKLENKNIEYEKELNKLKEDILSIENGNFDSKYNDSKIKSSEDIKKTNEKLNLKRINREEKQEEKKKFAQKGFDINSNKHSNYNIHKEEQRFLHICSKIPPYILRNLKEMPNNKGYIHKGVWCFGELPREENANLIMFKKEDNDLMEIHEIDNNFHYIYEKIGKNRKTLLYKIERNKKIQKYLLNQNI